MPHPERGLSMSEPADAGCLELVGPLTVRNIEEVRARLLEAAGQHRDVIIDCTLVTAIDLSFIQLVLAARRSAIAAGRTVSLSHPADGILYDRLLQAGILGAGAAEPAGDRALWLNEEAA
jgi:ABC-type transporter Mla MlaB component